MKKIFPLFLAILLLACQKDIDRLQKISGATWNPEFAVPLVKSNFKFQEVLKDSLFDFMSIDENGFITLHYEGLLFSFRADQAVEIPNQTFSETFTAGPGNTVPFVPTDSSVTIAGNSFTIPFTNMGGNQLDSVILDGGQLLFDLTSSFQNDIQINLSIPQFKKNGLPLQETILVDYPNSNTIKSVSLSGYHLNFSSNSNTNSVDIQYDITVIGEGNPVLATDAIDFNVGISSIDYDRIHGIIDIPFLASQPDTINIAVFNIATGHGNFNLVNPSLEIKISNSFGLPLAAIFTKLEGINELSGITHDLSTNPDIPYPLILPAPSVLEMGTFKVDSFKLENADIADFVNDKPSNLIYAIQAGVTSTQGFLIDTSVLKVNTKVNLPMHGTADIFEVIDSLDIDISSINNIEKLDFAVAIDNGFPLDIFVQVYQYDDAWNLIDSLLPPSHNVWAAAEVNNQGEVIQNNQQLTRIVLDLAHIDRLVQTQHLILKYNATSAENASKNIKLYDYYEFDVKMGLILKAKIEL